MWPPLLMLDPPSARSALQYRFDRLPEARAKAAACSVWPSGGSHSAASHCQLGYAPPPEAAMFPWESALSGAECQENGGLVGHWGLFEQHITGDISLAARQCARPTA